MNFTIVTITMEEKESSNNVTTELEDHDARILSEVEADDDAISEDLEEHRGQKRALASNDDAIESQDQPLSDSLTTSRDLPPGVVVSWKDNSTAIATFSSAVDTSPSIQLCFIGRARICCLEGQAEILGHILLPHTPEVSIGSPFWSSWMTIDVPKTETGTISAKVQFSSVRGSPSFRLVPPNRPVVIPPSWKASVDQICQDFLATPPPFRESLEDDSFHHPNGQVVMICGAKGVGKSTFLRYLNNRLLQSNSNDKHPCPVAILDADVGQPELAPPGMLRLSLQRRPLLHPPHGNLCDIVEEPVEHINATYFGAVTSKVDPTKYIEGIQRLLQKYRELLAQSATTIPLVINLDGWIKGMGFEILTSLISSTRPSHVCQLLGESKGKTFDLSDVVTPRNDSNDQAAAISNSQLFFLDVCNKHATPVTIPSSSLRTIRLATYFGPHLVSLWDTLDFLSAKQLQTGWSGDDDCTLAHYLAKERPYCVPIEAVRCVHANEAITEEWGPLQRETQLLRSFNGSIVGLCTVDEMDCVGLGIVRSIDWKNRLLYILTPVPPSQLCHVTTLVGGNIPLPPPFVYRGVNAESFPYLTTVETTTMSSTTGSGGVDVNNSSVRNNKILGSEPMKSRNNIGRRGFTGGGGTPGR